MLTVQCIEDPSLWQGLRAAWEPLADGVPLRSWAWLGNWWNAFGRRHHLCVLAARDAREQLVGMLPLYREGGRQGSILRAVGDGRTCTDYFSLLCQRERTAEVAAAFAGWLQEAIGTADHWDQIDLEGVVGGDARVEALVSALQARGARALAVSRMHVWRLPVEATREAFLAKLSRNHRKQLKKLERKIAGVDGLRIRRARSASDVAEGLQILETLHRARWQTESAFREPPFRDFLIAACQEFHGSGRLECLWVERHGRPLAIDLHFRGARGLFCYLAGMDPEARDLQPGRILNLEAVRIAQEEGLEFLDFLRGDEPYKAQWRAESTPLVRLRICSPAFPMRLNALRWETEVRLKNWARSRIGRREEQIIPLGLAADPASPFPVPGGRGAGL